MNERLGYRRTERLVTALESLAKNAGNEVERAFNTGVADLWRTVELPSLFIPSARPCGSPALELAYELGWQAAQQEFQRRK